MITLEKRIVKKKKCDEEKEEVGNIREGQGKEGKGFGAKIDTPKILTFGFYDFFSDQSALVVY